GQVTQNDLSVKFDTSNVNRTGEQTIPITVSNASKSLDFDISSVYPSSIEAYFDVNESKAFDIYLKYDEDNVADGYTFGDPVLSEDKVIISGPKTYVDKIERASVDVNFGADVDLTEPYNIDCNIDIEGTGVETSYLTITSRNDTETPIKSVSVTLPVLKMEKLPVSVNFEDEPSDLPKDAITVEYSSKMLNAGLLDSANINKAVIGTISFKNLTTGENKFTFDVTNLQGITLLDKNIKKVTATVTVNSNYTTQTISINKQSIIVEGVPKGYKAVVKSIDSNRITVIAPKDTTISDNDVELKCDVTEQKDDNKYVIASRITSNNTSWVYGTYTATIELVKA
ncbi:MAG: YbbR-like domain-containing protein, partial [Eubacterium sp.]